MQAFPSSSKHLTSGFILTLLFLLFFAFRIYMNIEILRMGYTENVFRVGVIPWSDAKWWADGAIQIINGEQIRGVATARPLYPLFMAVLFFLLGPSYVFAIYAQMMLSALVLVMAYYLLKPVQNRVGVLLFLSFLSIWRPDVSTVFMTENLGIYTLILCFAMLWRGLSIECEKTTLSGIFLLGFSQAVRPWCIMSLATVPFFCFVTKKPLKAKFRSFVLHVLLISIGFGFHTIAAGLFNKPGEDYANYLQILYGQVAGGKGWPSVHNDPIIKAALKKDISAKENKRIIFQRIKALFLENPKNFLKACISGYRYYFSKIPDEFEINRKNSIYFAIFFLLLSFLDGIWKPRLIFQKLSQSPLILVITICGILLFYFKYAWFWMLFALLGMFFALYHPRDRTNAFMLLFFAGIMLSIPLVGKDGLQRVKIGSDIFLYMMAALGMHKIFLKTTLMESFKGIAPEKPFRKMWLLHPMGIVLGAIILFLFMPFMIQLIRGPAVDTSKLQSLSAEDVAKRLNLKKIPLEPKQLDTTWHQWPASSFEKLNGRTAYFTIRYSHRDTVFLDTHQGIGNMNPVSAQRHWPLNPIYMKRAVTILETWYTLFPNFSPKDLEPYEDRKIIVVGKLITRPRRFMHATPFVLFVSHIISTGESGDIEIKAI